MSFFQSLTSSLRRSAAFKRVPAFLAGFSAEQSTYTATFEIPYVQRVTVGVEASSHEHARHLIDKAYRSGTIFSDTPAMPVLTNGFEQTSPDSFPLTALEEVDEMPPPDISAIRMKALGFTPELLRSARMFHELIQEVRQRDDTDELIMIEVTPREATRLEHMVKALAEC